jgi:hypothetical protein
MQLLEVLTESGPVQAWALVLSKPGFSSDVNPSWRYADMLYKSACYHGFPESVQARYLTLRRHGLKHTYYLRYLMPLVKRLVPYMPPIWAFRLVMYGLPLLFILALIRVCVCVF